MRRRLTLAALAASGCAAIGAAAPIALPDAGPPTAGPIAQARQATAGYRTLGAAAGAGFRLLPDARGTTCIAMPGMGAMGVHYVDGARVHDARIAPAAPEALVYQPRGDGQRLVALEYVVFRSAWSARHDAAPSLFGHRFTLTPSPNRFGLPAFYSLHAWLWKGNPAGTFSMWNPTVSCGAEDGGRAEAPVTNPTTGMPNPYRRIQ